MAEEFISKTKLLKIINENIAESPSERCAQLLEAILEGPPRDVIKVVRCKDCRIPSEDGFCFRDIGSIGYRIVSPDGFCNLGEPKTELEE